MTAPGGLSLARVTVAAPKRRMDVALPDNMLLAELMPHLLRHAGDDLGDNGEQQGGWVLRRATGALLEPGRSLAVQGVRDGELLHLAPGRDDWPEMAYDDVVEIIASGARRSGRSWGGQATRRCGLAVAVAALGTGLVGLLTSSPVGAATGGVALGVAALLAVVGILLSRAFADAAAGAVVAAAGLPYAFAGGALLAAPAGATLTGLGSPSLLLGAAALLLASVLGYTAVAAVQRLFMAGISVGLTGGLAGLLCLVGLTSTGAAAVALTTTIGLLPSYPLIASSLGRMPMPELPGRPEEILADRPMPRRSDVFTTVARSTELLTGMLLAVAISSAASVTYVAVNDGTPAGALLALSAGGALLLRARLFPLPQQRIPLIVSGLFALAALMFAGLLGSTSTTTRIVLLSLVLATAGIALAAGLVYSRRSPTPYVGRAADIADVLAIMALIPLTCAVIGLFGAIRGLFASIGG